MNPRAVQMSRKLAQGLLDFGPDRSRLLLKIVRELGRGLPVTSEQVRGAAAEVGLEQAEAEEFLAARSEHNQEGGIVGIAGLSLNRHPHRLLLGGKRFSTWCAADALFLPRLLGRVADVRSRSPLSGESVRLKVAPDGVRSIKPPSAVISLALVDPEQQDMSSVDAVWNVFCRHVHFFADRDEAERWAGEREDIAIVSVAEGLELAQEWWARVLAHEP